MVGQDVGHQQAPLPSIELLLIVTLQLEQCEVNSECFLQKSHCNFLDLVLVASDCKRVTNIYDSLGYFNIAQNEAESSWATDSARDITVNHAWIEEPP